MAELEIAELEKYEPPFEITNNMLDLVASISEKVGRINTHEELESRPHLRRNNKIESVYSSLRIEANSMSLNEVRDIIDGHAVVGDEKEIQEVKNAYKAYSYLSEISPYSIDDLKRVHGIMTASVIEESGEFRKGNEGVFAGGECIFVAPPPKMVPSLVRALFNWMDQNKDELHPLILSAVFHYEFVFIHPFADGNGRMARLWHTSLLYKWRDIFEYIPLESQIESFQQEYYQAIENCHRKESSNDFIEFMLMRIDEILDRVIDQLKRNKMETSEYVRRLLDLMDYDVPYTAISLMDNLDIKSRETFRKNYLHPAIEQGYVILTIPDKPTSRNQRYVRVK